jgi:hypothetical protein
MLIINLTKNLKIYNPGCFKELLKEFHRDFSGFQRLPLFYLRH